MNKFQALGYVTMMFPAVLPAQERERAATPSTEAQAIRNEARERRSRAGNPWIPARPLIQRDGKRWVGPVYARNAFRLEHPWQAGHFTRGVGPRYIWKLKGGNRERFSLGGGWFALAPADYPHATEYRWDVDEVVIYPDTDHDGWYLAYNTRLGTYTHVRFLGY